MECFDNSFARRQYTLDSREITLDCGEISLDSREITLGEDLTSHLINLASQI